MENARHGLSPAIFMRIRESGYRELKMTKKIIAISLILLTGAAWIYLDYLNEKEKAAFEEMHRAVMMAHARAAAEEKAKAGARARFEAEVLSDYTACNVAAEKAEKEYLAQHRKQAGNRQDRTGVSQTGMGETGIPGSGLAVCRKIYDIRLRNGI